MIYSQFPQLRRYSSIHQNPSDPLRRPLTHRSRLDGGAIGYPELSTPRRTAPGLQMTHLGVVIPAAWLAFLRPGSTSYRRRALSDLMVVLEWEW